MDRTPPYTVRLLLGSLINFPEVAAGIPQDFELEEVAWSLAHTFRYGAHTRQLVTVAEHSIVVGRRAEQLQPGAGRHGFVHDFHEGLGLGDRPAPLGHFMREHDDVAFDLLATRLDDMIFDRWDIVEYPAIVKQADHEAGAWERANLRGSEVDVPTLDDHRGTLIVSCMTPSRAYAEFMKEAERWRIT
jgi:hypothetical protein